MAEPNQSVCRRAEMLLVDMLAERISLADLERITNALHAIRAKEKALQPERDHLNRPQSQQRVGPGKLNGFMSGGVMPALGDDLIDGQSDA